jgi:uncharacterized surface protein with fasciclin (FAS1) repeats
MKYLLATILAFGLLANTATAHCGACGTEKDHGQATKATAETNPQSILETAKAAGSFKTLVAAIEAAELTDALMGEGPFTVFAPTDEAFAALPAGTIESLLKNKGQLASILTYHVLEGAVKAESVVGIDKAETLNGQSVMVKVSDGKVMIDQARVVTTDIVCSNGIIHVIDAVMLPKMEKKKG